MRDVLHPVFRFVGGEYDMMRTAVTLPAAGICEVAAHENFHERVFTETSDGVMLATAVRLLRAYDTKSRRLPAGIKKFVDCVTQGSLSAHESAATYLGVKFCATSMDVGLHRSKVPKTYLKYYDPLAGVIDPVFLGPNVQSAIAWGITLYAFSSRLIFSARPDDWRSVIPNTEQDLPDTRFNKLLEALSATTQQLLTSLRHLFETTCHKYQVKPWDFQTEVAWETKDIRTDLAVELDERLVKATFEWLRKTSDVACIDFEREAETVNNLLRGLAKAHDVDLPNEAADAFRACLRSVAGSLDLDNPGNSEQELFQRLRDLSRANIDLSNADE